MLRSKLRSNSYDPRRQTSNHSVTGQGCGMTDRSRTSLTPHAPSMRDPDPANTVKAARAAYVESKGEIVLIKRSWLPSWADRKQLELLAEKSLGVKGMGRG